MEEGFSFSRECPERRLASDERKSSINPGLRFECTRCSKCCRHTPGYVSVSAADLELLARSFPLSNGDFLNRYCRTVDLAGATGQPQGKTRISIASCGKTADAPATRPVRCSAEVSLFWSACVSSIGEWQNHARNCAGMGKGVFKPGRDRGVLTGALKKAFLEAE